MFRGWSQHFLSRPIFSLLFKPKGLKKRPWWTFFLFKIGYRDTVVVLFFIFGKNVMICCVFSFDKIWPLYLVSWWLARCNIICRRLSRLHYLDNSEWLPSTVQNPPSLHLFFPLRFSKIPHEPHQFNFKLWIIMVLTKAFIWEDIAQNRFFIPFYEMIFFREIFFSQMKIFPGKSFSEHDADFPRNPVRLL